MVVARPVGTAELAVIRPSLRDLLADVLRSILPSSELLGYSQTPLRGSNSPAW